MREAAYIVGLLFQLYLACGMMVIGFGYMVAGRIGGRRAARFYFAGPGRWALRQLGAATRAALRQLWALVWFLLGPLGWGLMRVGRGARALRRRQTAPSEAGPGLRRAIKRLMEGFGRWHRAHIGMHSLVVLLVLLCMAVGVLLASVAVLFASS